MTHGLIGFGGPRPSRLRGEAHDSAANQVAAAPSHPQAWTSRSSGRPIEVTCRSIRTSASATATGSTGTARSPSEAIHPASLGATAKPAGTGTIVRCGDSATHRSSVMADATVPLSLIIR